MDDRFSKSQIKWKKVQKLDLFNNISVYSFDLKSNFDILDDIEQNWIEQMV